MIVSLLLIVLLFLLGAALLTMSETESVIAANDEWSEGALQAADAAVQVGIDQLSSDPDSLTQVVDATEIGGRYTFRSGGRDDTEPQPPQLSGSIPGPGYSIGESTGYNSTQYVFELYQVSGTGTGPRNAVREVEVQVVLGPLAR